MIMIEELTDFSDELICLILGGAVLVASSRNMIVIVCKLFLAYLTVISVWNRLLEFFNLQIIMGGPVGAERALDLFFELVLLKLSILLVVFLI